MFKTGRLMCHGIGGKIDTVASRTLAIYACTTMKDNRFLCPCRLANKKLIVNTNTLTRASPMASHGALPALHMCNADGDVPATRTPAVLRRAETPGRMCALVHLVPSSVVDKSRILFI